MSVQLAQNFPLNPLFSQSPEKTASKARCNATLLRVAATVSIVALAAICVTVLAAAIIAGTTTGTLPFILAGLSLLTPVLAIVSGYLYSQAKTQIVTAEFEEKVACELALIKDWSDEEIREFIKHHFSAETISSQLKESSLPPVEFSPKLFLPFIARHIALKKDAQSKVQTSTDVLNQQYEDQELRSMACQTGYYLYELALRSAANAALMLNIIAQPSIQATEIGQIGSLQIKSYGDRIFDRQYQKTDDFLVYHREGIPPLTLRQINDEAPHAVVPTLPAVLEQAINPEDEIRPLPEALNPARLAALIPTAAFSQTPLPYSTLVAELIKQGD